MARPGPSTRGGARRLPAAAYQLHNLVLDQGAELDQRARHGLDSPPDLRITQGVPDLALHLFPYHVPAHATLGSEFGKGGFDNLSITRRSEKRALESGLLLGRRTGRGDHHAAHTRIYMIEVASTAGDSVENPPGVLRAARDGGS